MEAFKWSEEVRKKDRIQYPFKAPSLNYEVLMEFLIARGLKERSRKIHIQSFERFANTFEPVDPGAKLNLDTTLSRKPLVQLLVVLCGLL